MVIDVNQPASKTVVINNTTGLHLRPAGLFAKLASTFDAQIEIVKGDRRANGKSILDIITLDAEGGSEICIEASGSDAEASLAALAELVEHGFATEEQTEQTN